MLPALGPLLPNDPLGITDGFHLSASPAAFTLCNLRLLFADISNQ